jgi:transcriptional regulator with XRE-family HTH domain
MTLGQYLNARRKEMKKTLEVVSRDTEISMGYLHKIETGKQLRPKLWALQKLAAYYGLCEDDLISRAGKISPDVYWKVQANPSLWMLIRDIKL